MQAPGSNIILDILDVLKKYSDREHALTQRDISRILMEKYGYENLLDTRRTTVRRNIIKIFEHFDLRDKNRITMGTEENSDDISNVYSQFKYNHYFTNAELRLIIDSIFFSPHIPKDQRKELIKNLKKLTSKNFKSHLGRVKFLERNEPFNTQLFETIKILDQAIKERKKVAFYYEYYVIENSKPHLKKRLNNKGKPRRYIINPYELVARNGRYYLVCNFDYFNDLSNYRVDRIIDIEILDENRKELKEISKSRNLDLEKYMREHIYMFGGKTINVRMKFTPQILGEFIDWFGTEDIVFREDSEGNILASVSVNKEAMKKWALQYAKHVTVYHPEELVKEIQEDLRQVIKNYGL